MGSRWELRHLTGSPGGGGVVSRLCHTLIRVNITYFMVHDLATDHAKKHTSAWRSDT